MEKNNWPWCMFFFHSRGWFWSEQFFLCFWNKISFIHFFELWSALLFFAPWKRVFFSLLFSKLYHFFFLQRRFFRFFFLKDSVIIVVFWIIQSWLQLMLSLVKFWGLGAAGVDSADSDEQMWNKNLHFRDSESSQVKPVRKQEETSMLGPGDLGSVNYFV